MNAFECLFCKIVKREIPGKVAFEDDRTLAFYDINPKAPVHILIVPKQHIASLSDMKEEDRGLIGHLHYLAATLAREQQIVEPGFRTVINTGLGAGQTVFHLHLHLLGGRPFQWPPG
jgi:histidine triad (HIT) family protein